MRVGGYSFLWVGWFFVFSFFVSCLCNLVGPSCIPPVFLWDPLGTLLMNLFAFTHKKKLFVELHFSFLLVTSIHVEYIYIYI